MDQINVMVKESKTDQIGEAYNEKGDGHQKFWQKILESIKPTEAGSRADFVRHEMQERGPDEESADYFEPSSLRLAHCMMLGIFVLLSFP